MSKLGEKTESYFRVPSITITHPILLPESNNLPEDNKSRLGPSAKATNQLTHLKNKKKKKKTKKKTWLFEDILFPGPFLYDYYYQHLLPY